MIRDERIHIRKVGYRRIKKARETSANKTERKFVVPKINFEAVDYPDLINWQLEKISEPPLTKSIPDEELDQLVATGDRFPEVKYPNHTQSVERCIKLVTEASSLVCGYKKRDGLIRSRLSSRKSFPKMESKSDLI